MVCFAAPCAPRPGPDGAGPGRWRRTTLEVLALAAAAAPGADAFVGMILGRPTAQAPASSRCARRGAPTLSA
jgi:hypothetical protein